MHLMGYSMVLEVRYKRDYHFTTEAWETFKLKIRCKPKCFGEDCNDSRII